MTSERQWVRAGGIVLAILSDFWRRSWPIWFVSARMRRCKKSKSLTLLERCQESASYQNFKPRPKLGFLPHAFMLHEIKSLILCYRGGIYMTHSAASHTLDIYLQDQSHVRFSLHASFHKLYTSLESSPRQATTAAKLGLGRINR